MQCWEASTTGEPADVLELVERSTPEPPADGALIEVEASGVNMADVLLCRGTYQERPGYPLVPGIEVAGTVVRSGASCSLEPGTRIVGTSMLPHGAMAEQSVVRNGDALVLPDDVDAITAAATHITYQTAWFGLVRRAGLRPGEVLLVHAGAGGTGSAAIALGRHLGARVLATAGGASKVARCLELGAHEAWDHRTTDVRTAALEATGGRGVDVVFDTVGGDSFHAARRALAFEGRLVVVGLASGTIAEAPTNHLLVKNYDLLGLHWSLYKRHDPDAVAAAGAKITELLRDGSLASPLVDRRPLSAAVDALTDLAAGTTMGAIVLLP